MRELLRRHPSDFMLHMFLGVTLRSKGRTDEGLRLLTAARALRPDSRLAAYWLHTAFTGLGEYEHASDAFELVRGISPVGRPGYLMAMNRRQAIGEAILGREDEARAIVERGLDRDLGTIWNSAASLTRRSSRPRPTRGPRPRARPSAP